MLNRIKNDLVSAMKEKDKEKLNVLRMVKGAIGLEEINNKKELSDDEIISIISKQIKQRRDAIEEFKKGNRQDLIDQNESEIKILEKYMPEQLSKEEVEKIINYKINELGITSPKEIGKLMGSLMPLLKGKADMGFVNTIIKNKLS